MLTIVFLVLTVFGIATAITSQEDKGTFIAGTVLFGILTILFLILFLKMRRDEKNLELVRRRGALIATTLAMALPDFKPANEFVVCPREKQSPKAWVSQESKQIQFLLPCQNAQAKRQGNLRKTKPMQVSSLVNVELKVAKETVSHYDAYAVNPYEQTALIAAGGTKTAKTIGY